jgi:pimeloyl-ACP methyl ester carboxylesterase
MLRILIIATILSVLPACRDAKKTPVKVMSGVNEIAYTKQGNADTTLLFIHGWCINRTYWDQQLAFFSPRYSVVSLDLPGFGESGKSLGSDWRFSQYTADVDSLIQQLELKNIIIIGHSMSGDLVLDYTWKHPEKIAGLIGIDNLHQPATRFNEAEILEAESFFDLMISKYDSIVQTMMVPQLFQPATDSIIRARVTNDILQTPAEIAVKVLKENSLFSQQQQTAMQSLRIPLMLLNSDAYPVNADSLNKYCKKGYAIETIKGSGHYPMLEQPAAFNQSLQKLLDRISKPQ